MTEHHPAIAEQIAEHQKRIAECEANAAHYRRESDSLIEQGQHLRNVLAAYIDAERRLLAALRPESEVGIPAASTETPFDEQYRAIDDLRPRRVKRDVRGAVANALRNDEASEDALIEQTGFPGPSVLAYLRRAVKAGELVRKGDIYRLPTVMQPLGNLAAALVEDILEASDDEILAEAQEDGEDPATVAADVSAIFLMADRPSWPPSPEKIIDTIRRAGDVGMSAAQLEMIGATKDQIAFLEAEARITPSSDGRYRVFNRAAS